MAKVLQALLLAVATLSSSSTRYPITTEVSTGQALSTSSPPYSTTASPQDKIEPASSCNADIAGIVRKCRTAFGNLSKTRPLFHPRDRVEYVAGIPFRDVTLEGLDTLREDRLYLAFCRRRNPVVKFSLKANDSLRVNANYSCERQATVRVYAQMLEVEVDLVETNGHIRIRSVAVTEIEGLQLTFPDSVDPSDGLISYGLSLTFHEVIKRHFVASIEREIADDLDNSLKYFGY